MCWQTGCCTSSTTTQPGVYTQHTRYTFSLLNNNIVSYALYLILQCVCVCREIRNVELLKLRFGESQMHYCEVMLKVRAVIKLTFDSIYMNVVFLFPMSEVIIIVIA